MLSFSVRNAMSVVSPNLVCLFFIGFSSGWHPKVGLARCLQIAWPDYALLVDEIRTRCVFAGRSESQRLVFVGWRAQLSGAQFYDERYESRRSGVVLPL